MESLVAFFNALDSLIILGGHEVAVTIWGSEGIKSWVLSQLVGLKEINLIFGG